MRRFATASLAFLSVTGTILVLPVYAAPLPEAQPVETSIAEVALGSIVEPVGDAVVGIDGEVQPDGVDAPAGTTQSPSAPPDPTGTPSSPASEAPRDEDVVVSGDELPGVPALTVSQPDTDPFSTVGVTWRDDPSITEVTAQIRVKRPSGRWSDWTTLEADDIEPTEGNPSPGVEARGGTAPYWSNDARGIEVVVQGSRGQVPQDVRVALLDPGTSQADTIPAVEVQDQANAAVTMPRIISRAEWGADESIMSWTPQFAPTIKAASLHHTAGSNNYTPADVPGILRSIYAYHAQTRGWGDIGYNVFVDKFGRTFEGRAGGLTSTVIGAHTGGFNTSTFGVAMLGNYDIAETPQSVIDTVADVVAWKLSLFNVDPRGSTVLTSAGGSTSKYAAGQAVTLPTIFAHQDVGRTVDPGRYGYPRMPEIRAAVLARITAEPFVRALYQDMMGRAPDDVGLAGWVSALNGPRPDRRAVSRGFSYSYEYRMLSITRAYRQVFNRDPDPAGISTWMQELDSGRVRVDQLRPMLMASVEFYLRGGSSDAAFVDNIYRAALDRGAGAPEIGYWANVRRRSGAEAVIAGVWGSPEANMRRVVQTYEYYLGRTAARVEQEAWLPRIMNYGDEQLREEIMVSSEYSSRARARFP